MLSVGEYIRTKKGYITKCIDITGEKQFITYKFNSRIDNKYNRELYKGELKNIISKHSFDIRDLIEEGDLVNGERVFNYNGELGIDEYGLTVSTEYIEIKSIVTHEMLDNMMYRVEE